MTGPLSALLYPDVFVRAFESSNAWEPVRRVRNDRWTDLRDRVYLVKDLLEAYPTPPVQLGNPFAPVVPQRFMMGVSDG